MYEVAVEAGQTLGVDIDLQEGGELDTVVRLLKAAGDELEYSDDDDAPGEAPEDFTSESYLQYRFEDGGTYYLAVSGYDDEYYDPITRGADEPADGTGGYRLTLTNDSMPTERGADAPPGESQMPRCAGNPPPPPIFDRAGCCCSCWSTQLVGASGEPNDLESLSEYATRRGGGFGL